MTRIMSDFGVVGEYRYDESSEGISYLGITGSSYAWEEPHYVPIASLSNHRQIIKCSYCRCANWNDELECRKCGAPLDLW